MYFGGFFFFGFFFGGFDCGRACRAGLHSLEPVIGACILVVLVNMDEGRRTRYESIFVFFVFDSDVRCLCLFDTIIPRPKDHRGVSSQFFGCASASGFWGLGACGFGFGVWLRLVFLFHF